MQQFSRILLCLLSLSSTISICESKKTVFCPDVKIEYSTVFLPRSQTLDPAFFNPYIYDCCGNVDDCYNLFFGFRFTQSMKGRNIKGTLFGPPRDACITFSGSKAAEAKSTDIRADDFGLAPNFLGNLCVNPRIRNYIIDFSLQLNLEHFFNCLQRTYFRINSALVDSEWDLNAEEITRKSATKDFSNFPATYMSVQQAASAPNIQTALSGDFLFGDMKTKWEFGKFKFKSNRKIGLPSIDLFLGHDFVRCENKHFGIFIKTGIPTGNRLNSKLFFQPIIGNGHHWELGAGIDAHYNILNCDDKCIQWYLTGCVSHLFKDSQFRSFDFKSSFIDDNFFQSGRLSRYLLLKEFNQQGFYQHNLVNAINLNTAKIKSSFDIQADIMTQLVFKKCSLTFGIGYDFYFRSRETIKIKEPFYDKLGKKYGIKGTTGVASKLWDALPSSPTFGQLTGGIYTLNSTESKKRILNVKGDYTDNQLFLQPPVTPAPAPLTVYEEGLRWDNLIQPPFTESNPPLPDSDSLILVDANGVQIPIPFSGGGVDYFATSALIANGASFKPAPVTLTNNDVDICSGTIPSQISHKFFTYLNYEFEDCCCSCWQPFIGIGGEIETAPRCKTATLNQWGVWLHLGVNF